MMLCISFGLCVKCMPVIDATTGPVSLHRVQTITFIPLLFDKRSVTIRSSVHFHFRKLAAKELKTNIAESEILTLPSGQEVEVEDILVITM